MSTEAERIRAAWEALDQLETDLLLSALLAISQGHEPMSSEQTVLNKFADLYGMHNYQIQLITKLKSRDCNYDNDRRGD